MVKIISIANDEDENQWKWWKWDVNWKKERSVCCVARQAACMMGSLRRGDGTPAPSMWFIALTSLLSSLCPRQPLASIGWKPLTFVCRLEMALLRPKYPIGPVFLQQKNCPHMIKFLFGLYMGNTFCHKICPKWPLQQSAVARLIYSVDSTHGYMQPLTRWSKKKSKYQHRDHLVWRQTRLWPPGSSKDWGWWLSRATLTQWAPTLHSSRKPFLVSWAFVREVVAVGGKPEGQPVCGGPLCQASVHW